MTTRSLSHRAPLLGLVLAWSIGSVLAHIGLISWPAGLWAVIALLGLLIAWAGGRRVLPWAMGLLIALAASGALRTDERRDRLDDWDALALPPREAVLTLRITRLFHTPPGMERAGGFAEVVATAPHLRDLTGQRIQFFITWPAGDHPPALPGVEFTALGLLRPLPFRPPLAADGNDFDRYLADQGVNFSLTRARLTGAPPTAPPTWSRFCAATGTRLEQILRTGLGGNDHLADLYVAMMLGRKGELGEEQRERFIRSGTMHLFAISGLHIAGIAIALHTVLTLLRLPRRAAFLLGTAVLWTYVEVTGSAPSAVRAFWMITCVLGARQLRVPGNSLSALAASALVVLALDPHQLFSAGFQMSYGIVAALLLYGVPLQERWLAAWQPWANLPKTEWGFRREFTESVGRGAMGVLALGLAATLVSTPATVAFFGLLTPGGFFVNLLLIPSAGLVLFAGVAAILTGLVGCAPLAMLFNHAAVLVLAGMEGAVRLTLEIPGVAWPAKFSASWLAGVSGAGMLAILALGYARGWRKREGGYWMPYVALGLVLVLGVRIVSVTPP